MLKSSFFALCLLLSLVISDTYLHMPRGSNDRLDEANNDRNNANRLFDSQNNNRGGYNVGWQYYYVNSQMMFQWTNQHGSNSDKVGSEFIIQMLCQEQAPGLRDGSTTDTIPDDPILSAGIRFGQHETYAYYQKCKNRQRNLGLFTADQLNPNDQGRRGARFTRQNENGNRYGFECPEERDYYPYWAPSPWIDIAILTSDMSRCNYYLNESQNVKGRYECSVMYYNNRDDCIAGGGEWAYVPPNGFDAPICAPACYSRDNHLGDSVDNLPCHVNISIPNYPSKRCVFRLRYNMSSDDVDWWNVDSRNNTQPAGETPLVAHNYPSGDPTTLYWTDNPEVDFGIGVKLQLNLNTNQYGRTFQDRTHMFEIRNRPASLRLAKIWNLNVRGKRGNIVQTYPAVEYDFVPNRLHARRGDYIHLQWTGSNTNDNGNDGQGKQGTDRSNFMQMYHSKKNFPMHMDNVTLFDKDLATRLAILTPGQQGGEVSQMDDAGTYFDAGLIELKKGGEFYYLSTRNNAFSNRDQKGVIMVSGVASSSYTAAVHARNAAIAVSVSLVGIIAIAVVAVVLFVTIHAPTRNAILNRLRSLGKKKAAAAPVAGNV